MTLHFNQVACCVCGQESGEHYCTTQDWLHGLPGDFRYEKCTSCGIIYQNPQVIPEDLYKLYPASYSPWAAVAAAPPAPWKRALRDAITITGMPAFVRQKLDATNASLLDVGCGSGKFMARIAGEYKQCRVEGVDFSAEAAAAAGKAGFKVYVGTLPEIASALGTYDVISMWWYLEHVPNPEEVLSICRQHLKTGGIIAIGVPNEGSINRKLFGRYWYHLDPPRHLWIFSPHTLSQLLKRTGFNSRYVKQDYAPWGISGSLQYAIRGHNHNSASWVESRIMKALFRPLASAQGLVKRGDTFAIYAVAE